MTTRTRVNVLLNRDDYQRTQLLGVEHRLTASAVIRTLLGYALAHLKDPELQRAIDDAADAERARRRANAGGGAST